MATPAEVQELRRLTQYTDVDPYDDTQLSALIDASSIYGVAEKLWREKAATLSTLVDVSESGSSRKLGDGYKNALAMAKSFKDLRDAETAPTITTNFARTRNIVRESA